jgi:hypothetical protein
MASYSTTKMVCILTAFLNVQRNNQQLVHVHDTPSKEFCSEFGVKTCSVFVNPKRILELGSVSLSSCFQCSGETGFH